MAPSRKKGASRAAAATAAARRQWKVGDLVLAKVKGFPAWPATVSEPQKWGYAADSKKVLVYFFGTQQIAFCNPADVEAFTEEKKESLLVKRHGKGSDFVRAVHEIVESYDKLKKEQVNCQSVTQQDLINENNNTEPLTKSFSKDEAPSKASHSRRTVCSSAALDVNVKPEDAIALMEDNSQVMELVSKEVNSGSMAAETGTVNTYLTRGSQAQKSSTQRPPPSSRRTRSSSRIDSGKNSLMTSSESYPKIAVCDGANASREGSARRNKRLRKSPNVDRHEVDSPDLVSNCSIEGGDSEILTADSDTISLNEGSTVESDFKTTLTESVKELCQLDVELSQRLEFQTNAVINKKKRKPSRKRSTSDAAEFAVKSNEKIASDSDIAKIEQNMLSDRERSTERYSRDDGDKHLPLVKRARVRMSRASSIGEGLGTSRDTEEKQPEVSNNVSRITHAFSNKDGDGFMDQISSLAKEIADNSSPQNECPATKPQLWEVRKNQFVGSLDGEATLPPSKRLHRALEAMSANAAEDGQASPEEPPKIKPENIECFSPSTGVSKLSMENDSNGEILVAKIEHRNKNTSRDCGICDNTAVPDVSVSVGRITSPEVVATTGCGSPKQESMLECSDGKFHLELFHNVVSDNVVEVVSPKLGSPCYHEEDASINCNNGSQDVVMPNNDGNIGRLESDKPFAKPDDEILYLDSNHVKEVNDHIHSPNNDTSICMECADDRDNETTKSCPLSQLENQNPAMLTIESGRTERGTSATSSSAPVETSNAFLDNQNLRPDTASDGQSGEKAVSVTLSSSSLTDGLDSAARATPHTSTCNASASDNVSTQINGSCSPTVQSHSAASRTTNWNTREADTSLASFEASLRTLTRTKESIGRATRIAIDCSKCGVAAKVVEILAHSLEHESSLHRRVDLFFLVDSIAQCSKGLKGEAGGIYPSAILAVLRRLLTAAAPPGSSSHENRRQCLKVLRVWQERRILPESIIRHHIRELDSHCSSSCSRAFSRRPLRNERSFDDPIRQMEGMLVDEYGSNSSIQLPGFQMPPMLRDEDDGIDSDGESFEAVTPEHNAEKTEGERSPIAVVEKHRHILEDVDGELEMEDVAPSSEAVVSSTSNAVSTESQPFDHIPGSVVGIPFAPPLPQDVPPKSPPLPTSPPPPPPPTSLHLHPERLDSISTCPKSNGHTLSQNVEHSLRKSAGKPSIAPADSSSVSDSVHFSGQGNDNFHSQGLRQAPNSANSSFSSPTVSNPIVRAVNNVPPADGTFNKGFRLRPPHPAPSNQFSYVQTDQRVQSHRDIPPPSHTNRFHVPNSENGNFYRERDRMKLAPVDNGERWRTPPFHGPHYPDGSEMHYAPPPYAGQVCEPIFSNQRWNFQPRAMNHRELMPHRPPAAGGPIPVAARGHNFWRPR